MKKRVTQRLGSGEERKLQKKAAALAKKALTLRREEDAFAKEIERVAMKRGSKTKEVKVRHKKKWGEGPYSPCPPSIDHISGKFKCFLISESQSPQGYPAVPFDGPPRLARAEFFLIFLGRGAGSRAAGCKWGGGWGLRWEAAAGGARTLEVLTNSYTWLWYNCWQLVVGTAHPTRSGGSLGRSLGEVRSQAGAWERDVQWSRRIPRKREN